MYNKYLIICFFLLSLLLPFGENLLYFFTKEPNISTFESLTLATVDFYYFWGVGRFINEGHINDLTNFSFYKDFLQDHVNHFMKTSYWAYPPTINFLICFVALFPYFIGYVIWNIIGLTLYYFACKKYSNNIIYLCILFTSPFLLMAFHYGQTSIMISSLIMLGLYYNRLNMTLSSIKFNNLSCQYFIKYDNSIIAGLFLGLATIKYPFVVLMPIYLFLIKSYKTLLYMIITSTTMFILSIVCFGLQPWYDYFHTLGPWMLQDMKTGIHFVTISPLGVMHSEDFSWNIAWLIQILISIISIFIMSICIIKKYFITKLEQDIFVLSMILYVSPYGHIYDMILLAFPLLYVINKAYRLNKRIYIYILSLMWIYSGFIELEKTLYVLNIHDKSIAMHICTPNLLLMFFLTLTIFLLRDQKDKTLLEKKDL